MKWRRTRFTLHCPGQYTCMCVCVWAEERREWSCWFNPAESKYCLPKLNFAKCKTSGIASYLELCIFCVSEQYLDSVQIQNIYV